MYTIQMTPNDRIVFLIVLDLCYRTDNYNRLECSYIEETTINSMNINHE